MPRTPEIHDERIFPQSSRRTLRLLADPLLAFERCENAAFLRAALGRALSSNQLPSEEQCSLGVEHRRSKDSIKPLKDPERAAIVAAAKLRHARSLLDQTAVVSAEVQPVLYYYSCLAFLDFAARSLVRRERHGAPGHGMTLTCDDEGWAFDADWPRKMCRLEIAKGGDFPFYIDVMTIAGWPSLFSGYRLHRELKTAPWCIVANPAPLFVRQKSSLDLLCNFDLDRYVADSPGLADWLGPYRQRVWRTTLFLLDVALVFVAASLARYYVPAWRAIVEARASAVYADIRAAFTAVSSELPFFLSNEHPFQYAFDARIGP